MITVRDAKLQDYSLIVDFQLKMAVETEGLHLPVDQLTEGVKKVFRQPELGRYFIAEVDGLPCASLLITYEWSDWRNRTIWWIQSVYVQPEFRRKGIFASMYAYIKNMALADKGVGGIRLYVDGSNSAAQKTYSAMGMDGEHYKVFEWMK